MAHIIFLRHGQARNNTEKILTGRADGVPLTDLGIAQAEQAAELIQHMDVSAIYTSPIQRARHTAEIVADKNGLDVSTDDRLIELDMGKFTGMKYHEIIKNHGNVFMKFYNNELEIAHNGIETFEEVKRRIKSVINHVLERHPRQNVVLVTHMDPIKAMLSTVINLSPTNLVEMIIANASLNLFGVNMANNSAAATTTADPPSDTTKTDTANGRSYGINHNNHNTTAPDTSNDSTDIIIDGSNANSTSPHTWNDDVKFSILGLNVMHPSRFLENP